MKKILSVSIAAYNAENYIRNALDSLIDERMIDDLEIFVIDDGGSDQTLEIANEYAQKYPHSIFPIHKENGGYGSTVKYGILHATGKYFKLLDADDWFCKEHLLEYIGILKKIGTDIIVTPYFKCVSNDTPIKSKSIQDEILNMDMPICELGKNKTFGMWALTYKTEVLKQCNLELPSHCLYTDQIYSTIPFASAKTIRFVDVALYCYRIDREGQSISRKSRINHVKDNIKVVDILLAFYETQKELDCKNLYYIFYRTAVYVERVLKTFLLEPMSEKVLRNLATYDCMLREKHPDIYRIQGKFSFNKKFSLFISFLRFSKYGKIGVILGKMFFPKDGIKNWA